MIRLVAVVETTASRIRENHLAPDRQVGEVAPAPRLDVVRNMVGGGRESKKERSLSKLSVLTTESGWPTENGQNPKILASQDNRCHRGSNGAWIRFRPKTEAAHWEKYVFRMRDR